MNVARSKKINAARLSQMTERNNAVVEVRKEMIDRLRNEMKDNRKRYIKTC